MIKIGFLSLIASVASAQSWTPASPYAVPSSFHALLRDPAPDGAENFVNQSSPNCLRVLHPHLTQGRIFESSVLERFVRPLREFPAEATRGGKFYHYTNAPAMSEIAKTSAFGDIFSYIRSPRTILSALLFFYVATDKRSSAHYGYLRAKVEFDPSALVLITAANQAQDPTPAKAKELIEDDIVRRSPDLHACRLRDGGVTNNGVLVLLAAEAKGVGLISYFGIDNDYQKRGLQWFQVLGPWAIKKMTVENK